MKKIIGSIAVFLSLLINAENGNNDVYFIGSDHSLQKIGIGTKFDNFSLEAVYKKKVEGNETDLKSYFKNGNAVGINFTYVIGEQNNQNDSDSFTITNFTRKNNIKNDFDYKLNSNNEVKSTIQNIAKLSSISNIKFSVDKDIKGQNNTEKIKTKNILKKQVVKIAKEYGHLPKNDVILAVDLPKTNKIVITFDGGNDGK